MAMENPFFPLLWRRSRTKVPTATLSSIQEGSSLIIEPLYMSQMLDKHHKILSFSLQEWMLIKSKNKKEKKLIAEAKLDQKIKNPQFSYF